MELRKQRVACAAVTVVGALIPFSPAVLGLRTLSQRDTDQLYGPVRSLVVEALRAGRLPLWNPYEGTGRPLLAEGIHSVLHPISLLGTFVAPSSIDFLILAYLVAAALGAFLLAQALGASPIASAAAGLAFALSGFSVSMTGNLLFLAGLSTLPWLVAAARTAGAGSHWGPVATAVAAACAFLSGDVQVALVGLALGLALAADAGGRRGFVRALAGVIPGLLLAGVQITATRAFLELADRGLELRDWEKLQWSLKPWRLLELGLPGLLRGPLAEAPQRASGRWIEFEFAESVYLGAPLLVAAALGGLARSSEGRRRTGLLLGGAVLVLLWLALGHHLGARQLLDWVPVWSKFRYSEKLMAPLTLCVCALGALGIDAFGSRSFSRPWTRSLAGVAAVALVALSALLVASDATRALADDLLGDAGPFYRSTLTAGLPHLLLGLGALLAIDRLRLHHVRVAALAILVAAAPAAAVYRGAHLGDLDTRRLPSPIRLDSDSPVPRVAQLGPMPYEIVAGPDLVETTARLEALLLFPALNVARRVDTFVFYGALEPRRFTSVANALGDSWARHARRFGLTHVIVPVPSGEATATSIPEAVDGGRLVYRHEPPGCDVWAVSHRPWAFFAARAGAASTRDEAVAALLDLMVRGEDLSVVVEAPTPPSTSPGSVLHVERATETVRVEAESSLPSLLVIQDAWWPGWRATIDGQPAEILAADGLVRAVRWPPGRHVLELSYDPPELRLGITLSAVGAALVVLLALQVWRLRRRRTRCQLPQTSPMS